MCVYEGKVKSSRLNLRETQDKRPLGRDPDRNWCHRHTSVKSFMVADHGFMDNKALH